MATRALRVLLVAALGLAAVAQAGETCADDGKNEAKQHFVKGKKLFDEGRYAEAAREFNAAYNLAPHPQVLFNIAACYEKSGDIPAAVVAFRRYVAEAEDAAEIAEIKAKLAALEQKVGEVRVGCAISPCQVRIDGEDRGSAPLSAVLSPGSHDLVALFSGQIVEKTAVTIEAGKKNAVTLALKVDPAALAAASEEQPAEEQPVDEPEPSAPKDEERTILGVPFWIAAGLTVAAGGATIFFGIKTLKDEQEFEDSDRLDEEIAERGERDRLITNIGIGVTGAAAATALAFAIHGAVSADGDEEAGQGADDVAVGPGPGLGLSIAGTF
jgi:tetratricopeptide (TPR) repeat protein